MSEYDSDWDATPDIQAAVVAAEPTVTHDDVDSSVSEDHLDDVDGRKASDHGTPKDSCGSDGNCGADETDGKEKEEGEDSVPKKLSAFTKRCGGGAILNHDSDTRKRYVHDRGDNEDKAECHPNKEKKRRVRRAVDALDLIHGEVEVDHDHDDNDLDTEDGNHSAKTSEVPHLPDEVWHRVFVLIPFREMVLSVSTVCQRWYLFAHDPRLWRRLLFKRGTAIPLSVMQRLLGGAPCLQQLRLTEYAHIDAVVKLLCDNFEQLVALDIAGSKISATSWHLIATSARWPLRRLGLSGCNVTDDVFSELVKRFAMLEALTLGYCSTLTDASLVVISDSLPRLHCLSVDHILSDFGVFTLIERLGDGMEYLCLTGGYISEMSFQRLGGCRRLRALGLCTLRLSDATLRALRPLWRHLNRLDLGGSQLFSEAALCAFFDPAFGGDCDFSGVTHLDLSYCSTDMTDAVLEAVARCCGARLAWFAILECCNVTNVGVAHILAASAASGGALESLDIGGEVSQVTDEALGDVAIQLPRLRYLDVSGTEVSGALLARLHTALPAAVIINSSGKCVGSRDDDVYRHVGPFDNVLNIDIMCRDYFDCV